jgi:hypothetical protein
MQLLITNPPSNIIYFYFSKHNFKAVYVCQVLIQSILKVSYKSLWMDMWIITN